MNLPFPISNKNIYFLAGITLMVKLFLVPFSQTVDADAVSRVFLSEEWKNNPTWIATSVWGPFHFYLNGVFLMIWDNIVYTPKVLNVVLSCLTLLPFYFFTRREFSSKGAIVATSLLALSPIMFRNDFMCLSETPYLLLIAISLNLISKSIRESNTKSILLVGFAITIAAGFRYEAWLMMAIIGGVLVFFDWKKAFLFSLTALTFPILWMISNYIETGDFFFSIQGNYRWTLEVMGNNDEVSTEAFLRRIWFFPFSLIIAIGIPSGFLIFKNIVTNIKDWQKDPVKLIWALLFILMLSFFIFNSIKGVLLLQHRFTGTLTLLSIPFLAQSFLVLDKRNVRKWILLCFLLVGFSFIYNTGGVTPLPRLKDQDKAQFIQEINSHVQTGDQLILDATGWDYTYFFALQSNVKRPNMIIIEDAKNSLLPLDNINDQLQNKQPTFILLENDSNLNSWLKKNAQRVSLQLLEEHDSIKLYRVIKSKK